MSEHRMNGTVQSERTREWIGRAQMILESHAGDALSRAGFNGVVTVSLIFKNGHIIGIDADENQKIRK